MNESAATPDLHDAVEEVLLRWQELRAHGETPDVNLLCGDRQELLAHVRKRLPALEAIERLLERFAEDVTPTAAPSPGWPRIPGYEILSEIGQGGVGQVFLARQEYPNRDVALKTLRPDRVSDANLQRFRREANTIAQLQHPNFVQIYEVGQSDAGPFFTMEYHRGGNLARKLRAWKPDPKEAATLVATLAQAMQQAHDKEIVHRDLKPANILLASDGTPRIVDFGLAKRLDGDAGQTQTGDILGTPSYMAPEQARGVREIGPAADIYALGAILYELLAGRPPFKNEFVGDTLKQVMNDAPPPPSEYRRRLSRDLEAVCLKCLEKEPAKRYESAAALADDLGRWQRGKPTLARPLTRWQKIRRFAGRHRVKLATALAAAVLVPFLVLAIVPFLRTPDPWDQLGRKLAAGGSVTLVPEVGPPPVSEWRLGDVLLAESAAGDGAWGFQTHTTSLLVLARDPMRDSYRLSAELRHVRAHADDAAVGLFLGLEEDLPARADLRVNRWLGFDYSDYYRTLERKNPAIKARHGLDGADCLMIRRSDGHSFHPIDYGVLPFTPTDDSPNVWRGIVADVSPDGISVYWRSDDGSLAPAFRLSAKTINGRIVLHNQAHQRNYPGFAIPANTWKPRRPLGVCARNSAVAFRNVILAPIPTNEP